MSVMRFPKKKIINKYRTVKYLLALIIDTRDYFLDPNGAPSSYILVKPFRCRVKYIFFQNQEIQQGPKVISKRTGRNVKCEEIR